MTPPILPFIKVASQLLKPAVPYCRADLIQYFCRVHAALDHEAGSIFVMDLLGGHAAESVSKLWRVNEQTGAHHLPNIVVVGRSVHVVPALWLAWQS